MKKQILALTLAGAMMLSMAASALAAGGKGFADVAEDAWYAAAAAWAEAQGLAAVSMGGQGRREGRSGAQLPGLHRNSNIMDMLRAIAGVDKTADLSRVDLQKAAESYLAVHGMTAGQVAALKANLSAPRSGVNAPYIRKRAPASASAGTGAFIVSCLCVLCGHPRWS